jgi:hypothetical protein
MRTQLMADRVKMTKVERKGYDKCLDIIKDERKEIALRTGAHL